MYAYFWDIETSRIKIENSEDMQVVYLSNVLTMNIETGDIVNSIFHRTLSEVIEYFKTIEGTVWVHNLDYELTFLLRELESPEGVKMYTKEGEKIGYYNEIVQDVILRDKHSPLSIKLTELPNITFRDSYALFNKSVAKLGKEIGLEKLEYDYKKVRLPWSRLEELDYKYNERDNLIVAKSIYKYMQDNNISYDEIPLTFTSFVKRKRKEFIIENYGKKGINKFFFDRNKQLNSFTFFELMLATYQGGLTASNINETGKYIDKGMYSIDIKSSYPFQMCTRKFPFYEDVETIELFGTLANDYFQLNIAQGYFGYFRFKNIRVKNRNYLLPISSSQLAKGYVSSDRVQFNGKLLSASEILLPCNNIDIDTINLIYNYDEIICEHIVATNKTRMLREEEVSFLLNSFYKKETITDKEDIEYQLSKVFINSMYGVKVTTPIRSSYTIEEGEIREIDYFSFNEEKREEIFISFTESQCTFGGTLDIFTDGCYITSYARYMLVDMMKNIVDLGGSVVYSDTDSIKFYTNGKDKDIFFHIEDENKNIVKRNKNNIRFKKFKEKFNIENKDYNKICKLGIWELENKKPLKLFVTYGAKKYGYITSDNEVKTTIAGCNKKNPPIVINNFAKKNNISLEESFKFILAPGTQFDTSASGRTVAYMEKREKEEMEHFTYEGKPVLQYGGIIIEDTTYTLNISLNDSKLINVDRVDNALFSINLEGDVNYYEY